MIKINVFSLVIIVNIVRQIYQVNGTIDVNLSELKYLAGHLEIFQCQRLIAALHYTAYELPLSIDGAERKVDDDTPCLQHLLHWNNSPHEGKGQTHQHLEHRLRQIGRPDLADWLGKTVLTELGRDLNRALDESFSAVKPYESKLQYPITVEPEVESENDPWNSIDVLLFVLLVFSLICLVILLLIIAVDSIIRSWRERTKKNQLNIKHTIDCECDSETIDSETELIQSHETSSDENE